MASVPNTRTAPSPIPAGQIPAAAAIDPAGFARQLAGIPEELLGIPAAALSGGGDEAPALDRASGDDKDAAPADPADAPTEAAQLAALVPVLQSLPAIVAAPVVTPAPAPDALPKVETGATTAPASDVQAKVQAGATIAPTVQPKVQAGATPSPDVQPKVQAGVTMAPAVQLKVEAGATTSNGRAVQPKIEAAAADGPGPAALPVAPAPLPTGRIRPVKPEALTDETGADTGSTEPTPALDAAAKEAISAVKRTIDAALRAAGPAMLEAAPKIAQPAVRLIEAALQAVKEARPAAQAADPAAPGADLAAAIAMPAAPAPAPSAPAHPREAAAPVAGAPLDLVNDAEWLDRLARDIAQTAGNEGTIRFRLHPQTLGHLRVELSQGDHGTSIRLTADTEQARAILADAQPRLIAEARAQGVRIAETHVDLSGSDRHASGDPRRQDDARQTPMIRTARGAAADADAPERPGRSRSDRYA